MLGQREQGFSFWIVQRRGDGALLGFCGFKRGTVDPILGEMEIGWRFREDAWGQGYAREAASACLDWAWANVDCERIFAITVMGNAPSWGLMQRLGMRRREDLDFDHPNFPPDHPLAPHITYEIELGGAEREARKQDLRERLLPRFARRGASFSNSSLRSIRKARPQRQFRFSLSSAVTLENSFLVLRWPRRSAIGICGN